MIITHRMQWCLLLPTNCLCCSVEAVLGSSRLSWQKIGLQMQGATAKVEEGLKFFARGARLLGSDLANGGLLFSRAALGEAFWLTCTDRT